MTLFSPEICEYCGCRGKHPECERAMAEADLRYQMVDSEYLRQYAVFGAYGVCSPESEESFSRASAILGGYLGRPTSFDRARVLEGNGWWFLPEGWIGMIGFIVEKGTDLIFPLGSGLTSRSNLRGAGGQWGAIYEYLSGNVPPADSSGA